MRRTALLSMIAFLMFCQGVSAWNDKLTHPDLTNVAIEESGIDDYLNNYLNLSQGLDTELVNESVKEWLKKGSFCEDAPVCRASNHFHNPHKDWTESCRRMKT